MRQNVGKFSDTAYRLHAASIVHLRHFCTLNMYSKIFVAFYYSAISESYLVIANTANNAPTTEAKESEIDK